MASLRTCRHISRLALNPAVGWGLAIDGVKEKRRYTFFVGSAWCQIIYASQSKSDDSKRKPAAGASSTSGII